MPCLELLKGYVLSLLLKAWTNKGHVLSCTTENVDEQRACPFLNY
jgi:hypothetical protein